jgi:glycosyltransferase involved in cell wall biosynthesis
VGDARHILHVFPSFDAGGLELRAVTLMQLLGREARHSIVALDGRVGALARVAPDVELELLASPRTKGPLATSVTLAEHLCARRPDLVLTYNWGAIEGLFATRAIAFTRVIHHEDGFGPEESARQLKRRVWLRRTLFPGIRALVVPSRQLERLALDAWEQPRERVHYLPNGVDLARFHPPEPAERAAAREAGRPVRLALVGRFRPEKNHALLLRAFKKAEVAGRAVLVLVGDGPLLADVRLEARQLGLADAVEFLGNVWDPAALYRGLDVFVMSSNTEQMPLSVLEAMATGLPVVSTRVGDVPSMVAPESAEVLVPSNDVDALAHAIRRVVDEPALRQSLGDANLRRVRETFALDLCLGRHLELYRRTWS